MSVRNLYAGTEQSGDRVLSLTGTVTDISWDPPVLSYEVKRIPGLPVACEQRAGRAVFWENPWYEGENTHCVTQDRSSFGDEDVKAGSVYVSPGYRLVAMVETLTMEMEQHLFSDQETYPDVTVNTVTLDVRSYLLLASLTVESIAETSTEVSINYRAAGTTASRTVAVARQGPQGVPGERGPQGVQGVQGERGPQGDSGITPDLRKGGTHIEYTRDNGVVWEPLVALTDLMPSGIISEQGASQVARLYGYESCSTAQAGVLGYSPLRRSVVQCNGALWTLPSESELLAYDPAFLGPASSVGGIFHTCVIRSRESEQSAGRVECWGGSNETLLPDGLRAIQVAAGGYHTCALKSDRSVVCWGNERSSTRSPEDLRALQIASGEEHTCALKLDQSVECWGGNRFEQQDRPADLRAIFITAGRFHTCALKPDRSIACWGFNNHGQADDESFDFKAVQIAAGSRRTCALKPDLGVVCEGQVVERYTQMPAGLKATQIAHGTKHACALKPNRDVVCWGDNSDGQLDVPVGLKAIQVGAGYGYTCALKPDRSVECWGKPGEQIRGTTESVESL